MNVEHIRMIKNKWSICVIFGMLAVSCVFVVSTTFAQNIENNRISEITNRLSAQTGRPQVIIEGTPVILKTDEDYYIQSQQYNNLPEVFNNSHAKLAFEHRQNLKYYKHAPMTGPSQAPVTIVEMTDLSCIQCHTMLRKADEVRKKYSDNVRYIHLHLPVDLYNATNPAAFYSRVAHKAGKFWEYREALLNLDEVSDQAYIESLLSTGVSMDQIRQLIRRYARQFYKELDADALLAKNSGEFRPPILFVNGVRVGGGIPVEQLDDLVKFELESRKVLEK